MTYASLETRILKLIFRPLPLSGPDAAGIDDGEFNALALEVYRYQRSQNEAYARFCSLVESKPPGGRAKGPAHWREIPAVPTSAFRHAALCTFPEEQTVATFRTSGTTGEGFGCHHFRSLRLYEASILGAWERLGLPRLPQIILVQRPEDALHSSLSHMMGTLGKLGTPGGLAAQTPSNGDGQFQTWCIDAQGRLDLEGVRKAVHNPSAGRPVPVLVLGTALAFLHLFEQLEGERLPLPPGSFAMETGGYKGSGRSLTKAALYAQFQDKLALEPGAILNEYSMTELSSQWYTRGLGGIHNGPGWTRALVVDPETGREVAEGKQGLVRLFDLANLGSVLAIQTQDLAVRRKDGFELLGRDPAAIPRGCSRSADELLRSPDRPDPGFAGSSATSFAMRGNNNP